MATTSQTLTAEDLLRRPDLERFELVRGELRPIWPPNFRHGQIAGNFYITLEAYVEANNLGYVSIGDPGFLLSRLPDIVLAPDVAFLRADRLPNGVPAEGFIQVAPDLAVEVVSPSDRASKVEEKAQDWLALGCAMVLVVDDRKRTVKIYRLDGSVHVLREGEVFDGGDVVPGFRLPLTRIFK